MGDFREYKRDEKISQKFQGTRVGSGVKLELQKRIKVYAS